MCGVAGIIGGVKNQAAAEKISLMLSSMEHRGPDDEGTWQNSTCVLGHKRLAIIDLKRGKQPISNENETVWITFSGCIYNYLELAQILRQKGHRFKTYTDTEIIVHAYEEYGERCVDKFIGMFAFAIWDENKKELFCARDRFGIKPFYYYQNSATFVFASEIKALLASGIVKPEAFIPAIQEYLTFQAPLSSKTLFKDIHRLLPGHYMITDARGCIVKTKQYWDITFDSDDNHDEDYFIDRFQLLLHDAVKIRMRSDVPLGSYLSGGLDSSLVACLATQHYSGGGTCKMFNGAFDEGKNFNETDYARSVAEFIDTKFYQVLPDAESFQDTIEKIIYYMDEPAAGPGVFPQFMVSRLASQHVKVVLSGLGGDEIFIGYARYLVGYLEECLKGAIEKTAETGTFAATLSSIIPSLPMLKQYTPMLKSFWADGLFESQEKRYFRLMNRCSASEKIFNLDVNVSVNQKQEQFNKIFNGSNATSFLNKMLYFDMKIHLPALLHVEDRTSMAWGVESRMPLLDHRICEFFTRIPVAMKFKYGQPKYLFKKAIKNIIPKKILNREDKMGFPVPIQKWYRNELKDFIHDILLSKRAGQRGIFDNAMLEQAIVNEQNFGRAVWGALSLELWFRTFIDY